MRLFILLACLLGLAGSGAAAQSILPNSFAGWSGTVQPRLSPSATGSTGQQPRVSTNQLSPALAEYGFMAGESGGYKDGPRSLEVDVYRMKDPSGAYGLLSYLRADDDKRSNLAQHAFVSENEALILAGNLVVDIHGQNLPQDERDLKVLLQKVEAHAEMGSLPNLPQQLPAKQMVPGTDKYVLGPRTLNQFFPAPVGDSVGFKMGAEAEVARYGSGQGQATLLLVDLPTPQIATQTLDQLAGKFNVNGSKPGIGSPLLAKRLITTLAIVAAPSDAQGRALLNEVKSGEVLTWDQPTPKGKQADIGTIVVGTIVGTGIICLFSIIAGLAFGGFRLAVKRALPGKVFDREKHMQVIQLGLSKSISAEDFYDRSGPRIKMEHVDKNLPDRVALRLFR
ncbi:MAG: DUF6599 family protein [Candidatus Acidiferrales bacterium]